MLWKSKDVGSRNQLHTIMKYQITCGILEFMDARTWCWQQWGAGIESAHWLNYYDYTGIKMPWAWDCTKYRGSAVQDGVLYLSTDQQFLQFSQHFNQAA